MVGIHDACRHTSYKRGSELGGIPRDQSSNQDCSSTPLLRIEFAARILAMTCELSISWACVSAFGTHEAALHANMLIMRGVRKAASIRPLLPMRHTISG
jgi:hypothetical protein